MRFILFIITGLILFVPNLSGRTHYTYKQLSINEGLTQANVTSILLDGKGNLWIGTKNGLNLYAQQKMTNFFHSIKDKYSLPDNRILHLEEDSLGNIWVATISGLAMYNYEEQNFCTYTRGRVHSSFRVQEGILFGGDNVLYAYNYRTRKLERIPIQPESPHIIPIEYRIQKILPYGPDKVLLATRKKGFFIYCLHTGEMKPFTQKVPKDMLYSAYIASDGYIYASFYGSGMLRFDSKGNRTGEYTQNNLKLNNNYVMDITEYKGKLWLATDGGGINLLDLSNGKISFMSHVTGDKTSLPVNSITCLYKDSNRNLWAGSVTGGAFTIKESYIKTYQDVIMNNANGLTEKSVSSIYEEKDGKLWIGTDGGGINLYDPKTDRFTHYPNTYGDKVISIAGLSDEELLVSLYTKGFFTFNKKNGEYRPFTIVDKETNQRECFYGYLPLANQVSENKIYILSYGAWVYHVKEKRFARLETPEQSQKNTSALKLSYVNEEFCLLNQGNFAFITNQENDQVSLLFETPIDEEILSMTYDAQQQTVWVGTNHGLGYYRMGEKKYKHFDTGLFSSVSYLTVSPQGQLWICAENKLYSYSIHTNKFTSWNASDGYLPNEIQSQCQTTYNREFIYLSGSQGLVRISTSITPEHTEEPAVFLADVRYNGQSYINRIPSQHFEMPWDYQSFAFTLGVKNKDIFQRHLLKYTVRSNQGEQSFETYEPQINLSSLSPGNYTLLASCYTKDGNETSPVQVLTLHVSPPWYRSTWFISLAVLLFITSTLGIGRWVYRKKTRQMKGDVGEFLQTVLQSLDTKEDLDEETSSNEVSATEMPASEPVVLNEADKAFLEKMDQLIHDNLSNDELSAKFLTDHLAMSRASLYNKVKALTGMGVNDYINRIRIERSVQLLTTTNLSINEISYEVGFSYPRYFSTSFKQMKGMTPTKFKEENRKKNAAP